MIKKIFSVFRRDLKVNTRDFMALFLIVIPVIFALAINLIAPGINDTTVKLAMLDGENEEQVEYLEDFANVELFDNVEDIIERVERRDQVVAILPDGDEYYIMTQGNESEDTVDYAKLLKTYYEHDRQIEDTTTVLKSFERTVPPLKKLWINVMIMFTSILGGMLIAINIVEEKMDNTVSAMNVTPISRKGWIIGKAMIGMLMPLLGCYAMVLITGFSYINFLQLTIMVVLATLMSVIIGFIQGINNDDIMSAAASTKMLFFPLIASIAAIEFMAEKWQPFFWWSPFYWIYKGNDLVLSDIGKWPLLLLYAGIVLVITVAIYFFLAPKIRKGLEH